MSRYRRAAARSWLRQADKASSSRAVWRKLRVGFRKRRKPPLHFGQRRRIDQKHARAYGGKILPSRINRGIGGDLIIGLYCVGRLRTCASSPAARKRASTR